MIQISKFNVPKKNKIIIIVIFVILISPLLFIQADSSKIVKKDYYENFKNAPKSSSEEDLREGYAIICGISDYPEENNDLSYCDDDVEDMYDFVQNKFHIPETNIIKLIDTEATISAISDSIINISSQMDSNDVLFFSYSGHGGSSLEVNQQSWSIESAHDYANDEDQYWQLSVPGATMMRVHFTRIDVEAGYDGVFIGDNNDRAYYYDLFTGSYTDVWSNWVFTDDIYVNLYTDYSNTDWGFEVDMVEIGNFQAPYVIYPYDGLASGLSGPTLNTLLDNVPGQVVTFLDSCNSGGVGQSLAKDNRYILTACEDSEFSLEDEANQNGLFTYRFLNSWDNFLDNNSDGVVSFEEIFDELYSTTVSRSTSLGMPSHPQVFDGIDGEVIIEPNAKINSVTDYGDDQLLIEFALSGLGGGKLVNIYYDFEEKNIVRSEIDESIQNSADWQQRLFSTNLPNQEISGITFKAVQSYENFSEIDNQSVELINMDLSYDLDYDGDSLSDAYEFEIGFNIWDVDWDKDELTDDVELRIGTDSLSSDTDYDGIPDGWEYNNGINPLRADADEDPDYDGLVNSQEFYYGTDPLKADSDNDNFSDKDEIDKGTDPLNSMSNPLMRGIAITGGIVGFLSISFVIIKKKFPKSSDQLRTTSITQTTNIFPTNRESSSMVTESDKFGNMGSPITQNIKSKFCANCGKPIIDGTFTFCVSCGHRL